MQRLIIPGLALFLLLQAAPAQTGADGSTPLHWASYRDDLAAADKLIRAGVNVNAANDLGATALWAAGQNGSSAMVRRLLAAGANPNLALLAGETPLMVAARSGYPDVVEQLCAKDANVNARGARGQTALMWAASQKHPEVVKILLAHHADLKIRSEVYNEVQAVSPHGVDEYNKALPHGGDTALMFAARSGDFESVKLLVAAGADVNDADAWGVSATIMAAHAGFGDIVEFFLEKGANPNAGAGFTALHIAVMRRDEKMAAALLNHGADANAPLRTWTPTRRSSHDYNFEPALVGATPFWMAARFTEPGMMRLLVKHGADPLFVHHAEYVAGASFQRRKETTNALQAAVGLGTGTPWVVLPRAEREKPTLEAVKLLVELGIDINAAGPGGRTALDSAQVLRFSGVAEFLAAKGAVTSSR